MTDIREVKPLQPARQGSFGVRQAIAEAHGGITSTELELELLACFGVGPQLLDADAP